MADLTRSHEHLRSSDVHRRERPHYSSLLPQRSQRFQGHEGVAQRKSHNCELERAGHVGTGRHLSYPAFHGQLNYTHAPSGPEKTIAPPFPAAAQRILHAKGHTSREKGWWRRGTDKLACSVWSGYGGLNNPTQ